MSAKTEILLTVMDAARKSGLHHSTVWNAIARGALPTTKRTRVVHLIRPADLRDYLARTGGEVGRPPADKTPRRKPARA